MRRPGSALRWLAARWRTLGYLRRFSQLGEGWTCSREAQARVPCCALGLPKDKLFPPPPQAKKGGRKLQAFPFPLGSPGRRVWGAPFSRMAAMLDRSVRDCPLTAAYLHGSPGGFRLRAEEGTEQTKTSFRLPFKLSTVATFLVGENPRARVWSGSVDCRHRSVSSCGALVVSWVPRGKRKGWETWPVLTGVCGKGFRKFPEGASRAFFNLKFCPILEGGFFLLLSDNRWSLLKFLAK